MQREGFFVRMRARVCVCEQARFVCLWLSGSARPNAKTCFGAVAAVVCSRAHACFCTDSLKCSKQYMCVRVCVNVRSDTIRLQSSA